MQFTEAQENAINAKTGTLLVAAGAGSGKTSVLTERIIKKISNNSENYNITDFLVVTFTRASATDLKNKISNAINKKLSEDINNVHLKRQQLLLSRASISTIHSFCLDLIRSNFEKLGIPAKFRMSDENEMSIIKRSLLDDLLDKYYDGGSEIYTEKSMEETLFSYFSYGDFIFAIENFLGARDDENIYGVILKIYNKITSAIDGLKLFDDQIKIMREIIGFEQTPAGFAATPFQRGAFFATKFGQSIRNLLWDNISDCITELKKMTAQISTVRFEVLDKKYSGCFYNIQEFFTQLTEILDKNNLYLYDDAYYLCENYENVKIGTGRIDKDDAESLELKEILDKKIKSIREVISYIQKLFSHDFSDIKRFAASYEKSLIVLKDFIGRFDEILSAEKMRLKSFEFSDLERFAVKLLIEKIGENGEIYTTDLAKQVKGSYKEIYIDEYQDTNKMQDIIFRAISTEYDNGENGNRFMVGDIKQSIYAFRGAKPDIFAGYSKAFEEYGETQKGAKPHKIYLKHNFRSSKNIIDFINYIFANLFSEKLGGIEYTGGEVLEDGRDFDESVGRGDPDAPQTPDVTFAVVEKSREESLSDKDDKDEISNDTDDDEGSIADFDAEEDVLDSVISTEAEYVALTIKKLLESGKLKNGEKILPRHITVLMRNYTKSDIYVDALKKYEISCYTDRAKGFLSSAEIMLIVSLLKTIDNPTRDIDLAAILKSPVFMFTLDDLIYIKKFNNYGESTTPSGGTPPATTPQRGINDTPEDSQNSPPGSGDDAPAAAGWSAPFYTYVRAYSENPDGIPELKQKCADFIAKLNLWRAKSRLLPVDKFIWYLYRQTDIMAKISLESFAAERKANLMLLYEYARKFEETTFKGLYGFLNYLNDVQKEKDDFERAKVISENSDVVKIMSVHKAKGLEFPVCILANTSGLFNKSDYQGNPVISGEGVYFDLKYGDGIGIEKTPFKKLFSEKIKSDMMSEEARILYVALTRAIDKLIIVGNVDNIDRFLNKNTEISSVSEFSNANNVLKWLAPILLNQDGKNKTNINFGIDLIYADKLRKMIRDTQTPVIDVVDATPFQKGAYVGRDDPDAPQNIEISNISHYTHCAEKLRRMYDFEYKNDFLSKIPTKIAVSSLRPGILVDDEYTSRDLKETEMSPLPKFLEETIENIPALAGTATHLFMQFADFEYAEVFGANNEAENLLSRGFLTDAQFSRIIFYPIDRFFASDLYGKIKSAKRVYRETPFNLRVSVGDFFVGDGFIEVPQSPAADEYILIQGAIDLFFEDKSGKIYVVDFKTDRVHRPDGEQILIERHRQQIEYYCKAVSEILNKPVAGAYIYSFALNQAVKMP